MNTNNQPTITLIRHAKSSWHNPSLIDFDRPLNRRGIMDAPKVGTALVQAGVSFDKVLCSNAQRARHTMLLLQQGMAIDDNIIEYRQDLYGAGANYLLTCIKARQESAHNIAIIGHNPGMEDLANRLADQSVGHMSTCVAIQLEFDPDDWAELLPASGKVRLLIKPRDL